MTFACRDKIFDAVVNLKLINPVGQVFIYSDLSMVSIRACPIVRLIGCALRSPWRFCWESWLETCITLLQQI
jgi:hypothetical protein